MDSRRIFIDQYCFGLLNHLLTPKDFTKKNFSSSNITVLDGKERDLNFIMKFTEETMIYIMKPNKKFFDNILQIHLIEYGSKYKLSINDIQFLYKMGVLDEFWDLYKYSFFV